MFKRFLHFIEAESLFNAKDNILLAVSGGIDSMVLCRLMFEAGFKFGIAHCNFNLRGDESDADEKFVETAAAGYKVPFFAIRFDTKQVAHSQGISIQMAARDLRYAWFEEICREKGYDYIATAHHLNDQAETFFINLVRGTGIAGLHGILPLQGRTVRPLLFATRGEILDFAHSQNIVWREDSSNASTKYLRNQVRWELLPVFEKLNPGFVQNLDDTIRRLRGSESVYKQKLAEGISSLVEHEKDRDRIPIGSLRKLEPAETWLFEALRPYGFSETITKEIARSLGGTERKAFFSPVYRLTVERDFLVIEETAKIADMGDIEFPVEQHGNEFISTAPVPVDFTCAKAEGFKLPHDKEIACFDYDRLEFPLTLRHWREGDRMVPFGMKGTKKLSDLFIDMKLPQSDKSKRWLLCSGSNIIWVLGVRTDDRFKITKRTQNIFIAVINDQS